MFQSFDFLLRFWLKAKKQQQLFVVSSRLRLNTHTHNQAKETDVNECFEFDSQLNSRAMLRKRQLIVIVGKEAKGTRFDTQNSSIAQQKSAENCFSA